MGLFLMLMYRLIVRITNMNEQKTYKTKLIKFNKDEKNFFKKLIENTIFNNKYIINFNFMLRIKS